MGRLLGRGKEGVGSRPAGPRALVGPGQVRAGEKAREGRSCGWAKERRQGEIGPRGMGRPRPGWAAGRGKKGEKEGDSAQEDRKEFSIF